MIYIAKLGIGNIESLAGCDLSSLLSVLTRTIISELTLQFSICETEI